MKFMMLMVVQWWYSLTIKIELFFEVKSLEYTVRKNIVSLKLKIQVWHGE